MTRLELAQLLDLLEKYSKQHTTRDLTIKDLDLLMASLKKIGRYVLNDLKEEMDL